MRGGRWKTGRSIKGIALRGTETFRIEGQRGTDAAWEPPSGILTESTGKMNWCAGLNNQLVDKDKKKLKVKLEEQDEEDMIFADAYKNPYDDEEELHYEVLKAMNKPEARKLIMPNIGMKH